MIFGAMNLRSSAKSADDLSVRFFSSNRPGRIRTSDQGIMSPLL